MGPGMGPMDPAMGAGGMGPGMGPMVPGTVASSGYSATHGSGGSINYLNGKPLPKDPWGNDYYYEWPTNRRPVNNSIPAIWSAGKDGIPGNDDDITNWEQERLELEKDPQAYAAYQARQNSMNMQPNIFGGGPNMPNMQDPTMMNPNMMDPTMMNQQPNMMNPNMMDPTMMNQPPNMMNPNMMDPTMMNQPPNMMNPNMMDPTMMNQPPNMMDPTMMSPPTMMTPLPMN